MMRNRIPSIVFGLLLIFAGVGFLGNIMDWWHFSLLFDGWWTLFIIIPCAVSMLQSGVHTGNIVGLAIGALLLMNEWNILPIRLYKLILPAGLVLLGLVLLFRRPQMPHNRQTYWNGNPAGNGANGAWNGAAGGTGNGPANGGTDKTINYGAAEGTGATSGSTGGTAGGSGGTAGGSGGTAGGASGTAGGGANAGGTSYAGGNANGSWQYTYKGNSATPNADPFAIFSGAEARFAGRPFEGGSCTAVFGGVELDLRGAIITHDVTVAATAVFGGVDIFVDDNVQVQYSSVPILGGIGCSVGARNPALPIVYVNSVAVFGGVDIK